MFSLQLNAGSLFSHSPFNWWQYQQSLLPFLCVPAVIGMFAYQCLFAVVFKKAINTLQFGLLFLSAY